MKVRRKLNTGKASALITRTDVVNPHARTPFRERLAKVGALDLRGNHRTVVLESGYVDVVAIDENRKIKAPRRHL